MALFGDEREAAAQGCAPCATTLKHGGPGQGRGQSSSLVDLIPLQQVMALQGHAGNGAVARAIAQSRLTIQRQHTRRRRRGGPVTPTGRVVWIVVRDRELGAGGMYAADLAAAKTLMMRGQVDESWTLVLSVHGSEDRVAAQSPPNWQQNAIFYNASAIEALFGADPAFVRWRTRFGPSHLVLNSCQVSVTFEATLIDNLTRQGTGPQVAQGLGSRCRPHTEHSTWSGVRNRRDFARRPGQEREDIAQQLLELNRRWGYFGQPPVPDDEVVRYFLDEAPRADWPIVRVAVGEGTNTRITDIPFYNRASNAEFRRICGRGVGRLRERGSALPAMPRR
jgi:hypothetical protein